MLCIPVDIRKLHDKQLPQEVTLTSVDTQRTQTREISGDYERRLEVSHHYFESHRLLGQEVTSRFTRS